MDSVFNSGVQGGDLSLPALYTSVSIVILLSNILCSYGMVFAWQTELQLVLEPKVIERQDS